MEELGLDLLALEGRQLLAGVARGERGPGRISQHERQEFLDCQVFLERPAGQGKVHSELFLDDGLVVRVRLDGHELAVPPALVVWEERAVGGDAGGHGNNAEDEALVAGRPYLARFAGARAEDRIHKAVGQQRRPQRPQGVGGEHLGRWRRHGEVQPRLRGGGAACIFPTVPAAGRLGDHLPGLLDPLRRGLPGARAGNFAADAILDLLERLGLIFPIGVVVCSEIGLARLDALRECRRVREDVFDANAHRRILVQPFRHGVGSDENPVPPRRVQDQKCVEGGILIAVPWIDADEGKVEPPPAADEALVLGDGPRRAVKGSDGAVVPASAAVPGGVREDGPAADKKDGQYDQQRLLVLVQDFSHATQHSGVLQSTASEA